MKSLAITFACVLFALICAVAPVLLQYGGMTAAALDIRQLRVSALDGSTVTLQGTLTRKLNEALYEFSDDSGSLLLDLDDYPGHRQWHHGWGWPQARALGPDIRVEIFGHYIHRALGFDHLRVIDLRALPPAPSGKAAS